MKVQSTYESWPFTWVATKGMIPTEELKKRLFQQMGVLCAFGSINRRVTTLFIAIGSFDLCLSISLIGISLVQLLNFKDMLVAWRRRLKKSWNQKLIPLVVWWSTWKERNQQIFEGRALGFQEFELFFLRLLYCWSRMLKCDVNWSILHESLRA